MESANIVGFQYVTAPANWSVFSPTFKSVSKSVVYLSEITPTLTNTVPLTGISDGMITIRKINNDTVGAYGVPYKYYPSLGKWTVDGEPIGDTDVPFTAGEGFAVLNSVKMKNGVESYAFQSKPAPIAFLCSGEVDLRCQNVVPANWSICGNNSPVKRYLSDFIPTLTNGVALTGLSDGMITVRKMNNDTVGAYGTPYKYYPSLGKWTIDGEPIEDTAVPLEPGEGFAVLNSVKMKNGVESYAFQSKPAPVIFDGKGPLE